ncbi:hypothetical protein SAMN05421827_1418 [Pedobacter terrae]|uniref:4-fold beta flower domain-containing protein n=1 Tax=Pedobacter terrae TaxID=405671 RepID=A0A1G8ELM3_9SPHI|nr:hypothetical protein [Pedobacter terrae]SDH70805.1 hypothetical protein SAMN05421827_1418 [Pedobacter terrae]
METTLYTKFGHPVMYISPQHGYAIYNWNGHALSYLVDDAIYGWRGRHLGWFINGIVYDLNGYRVGYTKDTCPYAVYMEYVKYAKYAQYAKYARFAPYARPALSWSDSPEDLESFLSKDKV